MTNKRLLLMSLSCWGDHHLDLLANWCLPSLLAPGNLPDLVRHRHVILQVDANNVGQTAIARSAAMQRVADLGVEVNFKPLLDSFPGNKYQTLGRLQARAVNRAKAINADFVLAMPDFIYADNHLKYIMHLVEDERQDAICRLVMSTEQEQILPALQGFNAGVSLVVGSRELATLALLNMHPGIAHWWKDGDASWPPLHIVAWETKNSVVMLSPHQTPIYLGHNVLWALPERSSSPLDGILDRLIKETCDIYTPQADDELGLIEVTPHAERGVNLGRWTQERFCQNYLAATHGSGQLRTYFINKPTIDLIDRGRLPGRRYREADEVFREIRTISEDIQKGIKPCP